ncbi:MAG TPA: cytochrome c1 [Sphingomonadales bacterium]|nr:cytochrome c1 [Sphingomonadales bacterium]
MDFLKKNRDLLLGLLAFAVVALFTGRLFLFQTFSPDNAGMMPAYSMLGVEGFEEPARPTAHPPRQAWSFAGPFGQYDFAAVRRGLQVYREVCSACHSLDYLAFRNLTEIGFSEAQAKTIAAEYTITDGPDDFGEFFERPGAPTDHFPAPFPNAKAAAAANGGKAPPDLSLMAKAREGGPDYIYALLTGYGAAPEDFVPLSAITTYNPYFPGWEILMAPPLFEGQVTFADGTEASVKQMAHDVAAFLMWSAEPKLAERHRLGFMALAFLAVFTLLLYLSKKRVWRKLK